MFGLSHSRRGRVALYAVLTILVFASYGLRWWLLKARQFDPDEFEHLHVAWLIAQGQLPYLDFFEHHTPWFHFALAPFFGLFRVESSSRDAVAFLFFARKLMWLLTGTILLLVFRLGKLWRSSLVGLLAALFLVNAEIFSTATLEIRPDVFACIFWLACLILAVDALGPERSLSSSRWRLAWSGVFLGAGLMSTQKVLFVVPGLAVALALYVFFPFRQGWPARFRSVYFVAAGAFLPFALTWLYFYLKGGAEPFIYYNFLFNLRFKDSFSPLPDLHQLIFSSPYLIGFAVFGLLYSIRAIAEQGLRNNAEKVLVPGALGVLAGVFIVPVPHAQYFLLLLPLLALFAAAAVVQTMEKLCAARQAGDRWGWIVSASLGSLGVLLLLGLISLRAGSPHPFLVVSFWFATAVGAVFFLGLQRPVTALTFFSLMMSVPPLKRTMDVFAWRNTEQIRQVAYVIDHTAPTDRFMDGFTGIALFRPHAYFFCFLTAGIQRMFTDGDFNALLANLQTGEVKPDYLIYDKNLRRLPATIKSFFQDHYRPVAESDIWQRQSPVVIGRAEQATRLDAVARPSGSIEGATGRPRR